MRLKFALSGFVLAVVMFIAAPQPAAAVEVWTAKYWNNRNLEGEPVIVRNESGLSHEWGDGSPHSSIDTDDFSAEWNTRTRFNSGTYRFTATVDDGMRVYVNGTKIIDVWYDSQQHDVVADVNLSEGEHNILVQYYEAGGKAAAKVSWAQVNSSVNASGLWTAEYFNNTSLSGSPVRTQKEAQIDYVWGGSPAVGVNADQFSARWSGAVPVDSGTYRFTVRSDDGARLWVSGQQIINQWQEQGSTTFTADIALNSGSVPVTLEYFDQGGTGAISLSWSKISSSTAVQPAQTTTQTITDWKGEYYNNINLSGSPVLTRNDTNLNFNWGSSSPLPNVVNHDLFSVRWTRSVNLARGNYAFKMIGDDGVRVWVNDQLVVDHWTTARGEAISANVFVAGGSTSIRVEYFELHGLAEARLEWSAVNPNTVVSSPTPTPTPAPANTVPTDSNAPEGYATLKNARVLTMRSGPGMGFNPVGYIDRSMTVKLIGKDAGGFWIKVLRDDGTLGWSAGRFLNTPTDLTTLPIVN